MCWGHHAPGTSEGSAGLYSMQTSLPSCRTPSSFQKRASRMVWASEAPVIHGRLPAPRMVDDRPSGALKGTLQGPKDNQQTHIGTHVFTGYTCPPTPRHFARGKQGRGWEFWPNWLKTWPSKQYNGKNGKLGTCKLPHGACAFEEECSKGLLFLLDSFFLLCGKLTKPGTPTNFTSFFEKSLTEKGKITNMHKIFIHISLFQKSTAKNAGNNKKASKQR